MNFRPAEAAFREAVDQGVFPGAVVLAAKDNTVVFEGAFGFRSLLPAQSALQLDTVFDLASLTKPLAISLALMLLVRDGQVSVEDRVVRFLPAFGACGKQLTTIRHLLTHTSGLPSWKPYYETVIKLAEAGRTNFAPGEAKRLIARLIDGETLLSAPPTQCVYSDVGFIVLGELVEAVSGVPLDEFCLERIYRPLGLSSTGFIDLSRASAGAIERRRDLIAPTEDCPWRKKIICGEVHDDNAYAMGGVAGHAGLFATARDVHCLLASLSRCFHGLDDFFSRSIVAEFFTKDRSVANSRFTLGWDTPALGKSASGSAFSPRTVGHLGFTGTSMWWDLEKNCHIVLLTNRVHPTRKNDKIRRFRPLIHDLIMKAMFS